MEEDAYIGKWLKPSSDAPLDMVGRKGTHDLDWLAGYVVQLLDLRPNDVVLDICCGNGLITARIAPKAGSVTGVDYSHILLEQARKISTASNLVYIQGNALKIDEKLDRASVDKAYLCFAFQYFDRASGREVLAGLRQVVKPGGVVAILEIPDKALKLRYQLKAVARLLSRGSAGSQNGARFSSLGERLRYLGRNAINVLLRKPTDDLGWWWTREEFTLIAQDVGFECRTLDQPKQNPHHTYRFDAILR